MRNCSVVRLKEISFCVESVVKPLTGSTGDFSRVIDLLKLSSEFG